MYTDIQNLMQGVIKDSQAEEKGEAASKLTKNILDIVANHLNSN